MQYCESSSKMREIQQLSLSVSLLKAFATCDPLRADDTPGSTWYDRTKTAPQQASTSYSTSTHVRTARCRIIGIRVNLLCVQGVCLHYQVRAMYRCSTAGALLLLLLLCICMRGMHLFLVCAGFLVCVWVVGLCLSRLPQIRLAALFGVGDCEACAARSSIQDCEVCCL